MNKLEVVKKFIVLECLVDQESKVEAKSLYDSCRFWYGLYEKSFVISNRELYELLRKLGYEVRISNKNKIYVFGLALKSGD